MSLLAKQVVKNKCWIVEDGGIKVGTILSSPAGVTLVQDGYRERFSSLKLLSERHNIIVDKTKPVKIIKETHDVYGYPCEHKANNILWDVQHKLPIFTKGNKSKSFFCAGYYIVQFNNGWVKSYCPKLITLNRYPYQGPYKTQEEMQEQLRTANGVLNGITTESTSTSI
jgi:hypothetical protein